MEIDVVLGTLVSALVVGIMFVMFIGLLEIVKWVVGRVRRWL